jgi:hypothetical protein
LVNSIYLFFRTGRNRDYTYLGNLKYLSHDRKRERPVYFQWQILDWGTGDMPNRIGLELQTKRKSGIPLYRKQKNTLEEVTPPVNGKRLGVDTPTFRTNKDTDFAGRDERNKELGLLGEKLVIELEKKQLIESDRSDLAEKVKHISVIRGDGAGYDIESFTPEGETKFIEVKTTKGSKITSFFISSNEFYFAKIHKDHYLLYRIFEYDKDTNTGKYFVIQNIAEMDLSPTQFRISFTSNLK